MKILYEIVIALIVTGLILVATHYFVTWLWLRNMNHKYKNVSKKDK